MKKFSLSRFAVVVLVGWLCFCSSACVGGRDEGVGPTPTPSLNGSDWAYYQQGNISSSAYCGYLPSYQMKLTLHYGPGNSSGSDVYLNYSCREDFGDVRFTEADGETSLDYWVQKYSPGVNATVWVEFRSIQDFSTSFYVFYGNPGAESESNGKNVFIIFNDGSSIDGWSRFEVPPYYFNWQVVSSDIGKVIRCTSVTTGGWSNLYWNASIGTDYYVVECKIRAQEGLTDINYQQGFSYYTNYPRVIWIDNIGFDYWDLRDPEGSTHSQPDATFNAAQWHDYSFVKNNDVWKLYVDDELKVTRNAEPVGQLIGMYANFWAAGHWAEFDDFRVRAYCFPEPDFGGWGEAILIGEPIVRPTPVPTDTSQWTAEPTGTTTLEAVSGATGTTEATVPEATSTTEATEVIEGVETPEPMKP